MKVDFEAAIAFVKGRGDVVERARLGYLLAAERPSREAITALLAGQQADGGWAPFWAPGYSSLDATCFHLAQAGQMGVGGSEAAVARAVQFLAQRQRADGSWEEEKAVAALAPPWVRPGDSAARLYLTANCGFWLAVLGASDSAARADAALRVHLSDDGRLPAALHAHWLAGGLWYHLGQRALAERIFDSLGARLQDMHASNLAWLIAALRAAGVLPNHHLVSEAATLLEQRQSPDGRWPSEDGVKWDVHSTLEALWALRLCGRGELEQRSNMTFEFHDPGRLVDGDLALVLIEKCPDNPSIGYVPAYRFKMKRADGGDEELGSIELRVGDTERLAKYGGHIGYGVHPEHRGNHYAARACRLLLPLARSHGMQTLWITCNPDNTASRRTCELVGAQFVEIVDLPADSDMYQEGERRKCRYRLDL